MGRRARLASLALAALSLWAPWFRVDSREVALLSVPLNISAVFYAGLLALALATAVSDSYPLLVAGVLTASSPFYVYAYLYIVTLRRPELSPGAVLSLLAGALTLALWLRERG